MVCFVRPLLLNQSHRLKSWGVGGGGSEPPALVIGPPLCEAEILKGLQ